MKKLLPFLLLLISAAAFAQTRPLVFLGDTIKLESKNINGATLQIKNSTSNTRGFLLNKGGGVTEFRRVVRINPTQVVFGYDTLDIPTTGTIINPAPGIDSLVFTFTGVCAWSHGESFCSNFAAFPTGGHLNSDSSLYIFVNSNNDSTFSLPTLIKRAIARGIITITDSSGYLIYNVPGGSTGGSQNFQQVTDNGKTTTRNVQVQGVSITGPGMVINRDSAGNRISNGYVGGVTFDRLTGKLLLQSSADSGSAGGAPSFSSAPFFINPAGDIDFPSYGGGIFSSTAKYGLGITSAGKMVTVPITGTSSSGVNGRVGAEVSYSGTGLTYNVTSGTYPIGKAQYSNAAGSVTLGTSDPTFDRIDVIKVDSFGVISVEAGTASANPATPQIDDITEYALTSVYVTAASTVPSGITQRIAYDEQAGGEASTPAPSGWTANYGNTTNTFHLTKAADYGAWTTTRTASFIFPTPQSRNDNTLLKVYIKLKAAIPTTANIQVYFANGTTNVTSAVSFAAAQGFDKTLTSYQNITLSLASVPFTADVFDRIIIRVLGAGSGFYLDYLQLQGGISNNGANYSASFPLTLNGSTFGVDTLNKTYSLTTRGQLKKSIDSLAALKQDVLVSGTNVKTVNGSSIVGSGNLVVSGGSGMSKAYAPFVVSAGGDSISVRFNVKAFGATGDGVTDDTRAIQLAINAADSVGHGGTVYIPNGKYIIAGALRADCNCQIKIPFRTVYDSLRTRITIQGESIGIDPIAGGFGAGGPVEQTGARLYSTLTSGATNAAVIASERSVGDFNGTSLQINNLTVIVKHDPAGAGPVVGGISYKYGNSMDLYNVFAIIDTAGYLSTRPTNNVVGIETPDNQATSFNTLQNTLAVGFKDGYKIGEHTVLIQAQAFTCFHGFNIKDGTNPVYSLRASSYWCAYSLYVSGFSTLANFELSSTWQNIGKWFDEVATVRDSSSLAVGQIFYTLDGGLNGNFIKSGGSGITCMSNAEGIHPVIGQNVGSGTAGSSLYVGASGALSQDNAHFFYDYNNHRLGIGTTTPTVDLEVSNVSPGIKVNRTTSTGAPGYYYTDRGTNKFVTGLDHAGNGTADWYLYDYANSKPRFIIGTAGTVDLGGEASNSSGISAIHIDNSNNIGFNNSDFTYTASTHTIAAPAGAFSTSLTSPLHIGGTTASSTNTIRSTSGVGTSDAIVFQTGNNGGTEAFRVLTGGQIAYGQTSLLRANNIATWVKNANSEASFSISNNNAGASAYTGLFLGNSAASAAATWYMFGGGYTTSGQYIQNTMLIECGVGAANMSSITGTVGLFTNNTERLRVTNAGLVGIGGTPTTDKLEVVGNLSLTTAGNKIKIATGTNASVGVSGAMTAGTITISTTAVTASSKIFLTHATVGGTAGVLSVGTVTAGTSFVINSSSGSDTSTVNWWIVN